MRHKSPIVIILTFVITISLIQMAYADHADRHIWIETAEGMFIAKTETAQDEIDYTYSDFIYDTYRQRITVAYSYLDTYSQEEKREEFTWRFGEPEITKINKVNMIQIKSCGDETTEKERIEQLISKETFEVSKLALDGQYISGSISPDERQDFHEKVCNYAYSNVVKNEYTYTIIDLPRDRELPPEYKAIVRNGIQAGLDRWGNINNITFTHTDSKLKANILIQQHIGNGYTYGDAEYSCIFDQNQCVMKLYTDLNTNNKQTLTNKRSIEWTTAHEFGHMIGLPHHIEEGNIMTTPDDSIRTYYEVRNFNVPKMIEPTYEQRLLGHEGNEGNQTNTTDNSISEITEHEKFTEFVEYISQVIRNTPKDDRFDLWWDISSEISDRILDVIFD